MDHTAYEPDPGDSRLARGYTTFALSGPEWIAPEAKGWIGAAGGIYSTPADLARWNLALTGGTVLKPESYALMTAPRKLADGKVTDYACGLSVRTQAGRQVLSHGGAVSGFNTSSAMIPSTRSAVIMTCNLDGGLGSLPARILTPLLKEPSGIPGVAAPSAAETVQAVFARLQKGKVDRRKLSEEFNHYLTDEKISDAAKRLKKFGTPKTAAVISTHERGGMEVTVTRLTFKSGSLRVLMYRMPDGGIEQFFVDRE
jgi:CubicO group peptidase (beta-lactamase class C family)